MACGEFVRLLRLGILSLSTVGDEDVDSCVFCLWWLIVSVSLRIANIIGILYLLFSLYTYIGVARGGRTRLTFCN